MRWARWLILAVAVVLLAGQEGCRGGAANKPVEKEGKTYGVTSGAFRGRWWNYYERGMSYGDGHFWDKAEADLRTALRLRGKDRRRARTYGMHFVDYFPHRELGVVLYHQGRLEEAARELETSLKSEKSAKAEFYLDCTRKALIMQSGADLSPPEVLVSSPDDGMLTNAFAVQTAGVVRDDRYVKSVQVNGIPVRVDLAAQEVPFKVKVPLQPGVNLIRISAMDLAGKVSVVERRIRVDRQGPLVSMDEPAEGSPNRGGQWRLKGYVYDDSGLQELRVNGREVPIPQTREAHLDHLIAERTESGLVVVEARDWAGNQTKAEIRLSGAAFLPPRVMVASLDLPRFALAAPGKGDNTCPVIELRNWTEQQVAYLDQVYLDGCVKDDSGVEYLAINGQSVLKKPGKSVYFNHLTSLVEGENLFTIVAGDAGGNQVEKQIHIQKKIQKVRDVGSRLTVALMPLERKGVPGIVGDTAEESLLTALMERGRFEIVERQRLEEILREQKLSRTELFDERTAIRVGRMAAVNSVLMGSTVENEGSLEVYIRLVDAETSLILAALDVYGEDLDLQGVKGLCQGLLLKLCDELPLLEGVVIQIKGNRLLVDLGRDTRIKKGMRIIVFEEGEPITHPVTGAILGADLEETGRALVQSVRDRISEVEVLEKESLERMKTSQKVITQ